MNAAATDSDHHHHGPAPGLMRWVTTTNHKDIGTLYLWFSLIMFFIGGLMALIIRAELFQPGLQMVNPEFFNQMTTMHALIMIFGVVMPAFVGLANWMLPIMVGAPDMALPRMNNWSFWILPFGFGMMLSTLFMPGGGPASGWTLYPPLSLQGGIGFPFLIFLHPYSGCVLHHGRHQYRRHDYEPACARDDIYENAAVRMDMVYHRLFIDCGDAGTGRGGDYAVDR